MKNEWRSGASFLTNNRSILLGHLVFWVLLIYGVLFYQERAFYPDAAHHLYLMLQKESFAILHSRYSMMLYEWIPVLGIQLGLNLKAVTLLFSLSTIVWAYLLFLYAAYGLKRWDLAIVITLLVSIWPRHSFYCVYEMSAGVVVPPLILGHLNRISSSRGLLHFLAAAVFTIVASAFHSALVLTVIFTLVFWFISDQASSRERKGGALLLLSLIAAARLVFVPSHYESTLLPKAFDLFTATFSDLYGILNSCFAFLLREHLTFVFVVVIVLVFLSLQKHWMSVACLILFLVMYIFLLNMALVPGIILSLMEVRYTPLSVFVLIPFVQILKSDQSVGRSYAVLTMIVWLAVSVSLVQIFRTSANYSKILAYKQNLLRYCSKFPQRKFIWNRSNVNHHYVEVEWTFPEETLLLSNIHTGESTTIYIDIPEYPIEMKSLTPSSLIISGNGVIPAVIDSKQLNPAYFVLPLSDYRALNSQGQHLDFDTLRGPPKQIRLSLLDADLNKGWFLVRIMNTGRVPLYSSTKSSRAIYLRWTISQYKKRILKQVPLDVDVTGEYVQKVTFVPEPWPGNRRLLVDLYTPGVGWWEVDDVMILNARNERQFPNVKR